MTSMVGARTAQEVLADGRRLVAPALRAAVDTLPATTRRIAGYHFGWWDAAGRPDGSTPAAGGGSGKALRPALVLLAARAAGGEPSAAVPAAAAVELVHNFSLIHDDVIDGDLTRRHRPTVWSVFGTGDAILAGSSLLALAFDLLAASGHPAAPQAVRMLGRAAADLLEGQHADVAFEQRSEVEVSECVRMVQDKSGALLGGACALGATFAGADDATVRLLHGFGVQLGLAFQLADDLLGIWGDPAVTGKPVHADLVRRKQTLPVVAALTSGSTAGTELAALYRRDKPPSGPEAVRAAELVEQAGGRAWSQARAESALDAAVRTLRRAVDPSSTATAELVALARLAVHRDH